MAEPNLYCGMLSNAATSPVKLLPNSSSHSKTVKQLFQENGVLPWVRDRIPLIYINEELAVIPGFCVDKKYSASKDEKSLDIYWSGYTKVIQ